MIRFSDAHYLILRLLAECGWVSHSVLELTGYSYTYRTRCLKALLDHQYIRKQGKGKDKSYALATKGRNHMAAFNAGRFCDEAMSLTRQLSRHPEHSVLRGDAAAMLSLAGFSVHVDDKPLLPAAIPRRPDGYSPDDWRCFCHNASPVSYPGEMDSAAYIRRLTPVNCYYDATVIKELADTGQGDFFGVGYSRVCGALMTPSGLMRVYHSRDVAMKFHVTGERNLQNLLLSGKVFQGHIPEQSSAVLIFGSDFTAAQHILGCGLKNQGKKTPVYVKRKGQKGYAGMKGAVGEMLSPTNLGSPAFYLPLRKESLPLLELMRWPFWQQTMLREINRELFQADGYAGWEFELDGCAVYILAALNLTQIDFALRRIKNGAHSKVRIICADWQVPLFSRLFELIQYQCEIRITRLPSAYMENLSDAFTRFWEG